MKKIEVLVVDDSAFMRKVITQMLNSADNILVVGTARDGVDALNQIREISPDVITLDVEMPKMNGLTMLEELMKVRPMPVVMLSSLTQTGSDITIKALEMGAVDFVAKPSGTISLDIDKVKDELIEKVIAAKNAVVKGPISLNGGIRAKAPKGIETLSDRIVVIGSSTGGPQALCRLLSKIPSDLDACFLVVQHMPPVFTDSLAKRINNLSALNVKEASGGDVIANGSALIAPGDFHMEVHADGFVKLTKAPPVKAVRPAADVTMSSVARVYGENVIGVVLTGMGNDGTYGMSQIKKMGGLTVAEDESTCIVFGMSRSVIEKGYADHVLPVDSIPEKICELVEELKGARNRV